MLQDDYIKQRFINASKKKKNRNDVREVLENLDEHTELLKKMLTEELFIPDYHKPSIINESSSKKTRRILKPHYKYEQVIHHCAIGQFKPIVMNGLYEFSCGALSGWMYRVDGEFPNYGCSKYELRDGQVIEWVYTCDLGHDVGCEWIEEDANEGV